MHAKLNARYQRLEKERLQLMDLLQQAGSDVLDRRIRPEKWSIGEILMHLLTAERMTVAYMQKKSLGLANLKSAGVVETLKLGVLVVSQYLPLRYKAPAAVKKLTPEVVPLDDLSREWSVTREQLRDLLNHINAEHLHKLIYRHPIVGLLDAGQCLVFMRAHFQHHLPQIKRLL